jgi:hypothetical protein
MENSETKSELDEVIQKIKQDFAFAMDNPDIDAIILYGSYTTGMNHNRSDIDLCFVSHGKSLYETWSYIMEKSQTDLKKYDIRFFQELPLYIQGEIIKNGIVIFAKDPVELAYYFYPFRKRYNDWEFRMKYCI